MLKIGRVKKLASRSSRVLVYFDDGSQTYAIAATDILSQNVAVFIDDQTKKAFVYDKNANNVTVNQKTTTFSKKDPRRIPETPIPEKFSPIKIFFRWVGSDAPEGDGIYVGGDRERPKKISDLVSFETGGFCNTGKSKNDFTYAFGFGAVATFYDSNGIVGTKDVSRISNTTGSFRGSNYFVEAGDYNVRVVVTTEGEITYKDCYNLNWSFAFRIVRNAQTERGFGRRTCGLSLSLDQAIISSQSVSVNNSFDPTTNEDENWSVDVPYGDVSINIYYRSDTSGTITTRDRFSAENACISKDLSGVILESYREIRVTDVGENTSKGNEDIFTTEYQNASQTVTLYQLTIDHYLDTTEYIHPALQDLEPTELNTYITDLTTPQLTQIINNIAYTVNLTSTTEAKVHIFNFTEESYTSKTVKIQEVPSMAFSAALYHP